MPGLEKSQYKISIHAPRVGSDLFVFPDPQLPIYFNPRSPCGERPQAYLMAAQLAELFQSTLPVWGATNAGDIIPFYCNISIHAPRVGSDATRLITSAGLLGFQSTLPVWGATCSRPETAAMEPLISIHAPRVGSDERTGSGIRAAAVFQSTLPVWGATLVIDVFWKCGGISIHAPRVGSDGTGGADGGGVRHFNPRSPCGERLARSQTKGIFSKFQSTLPVWGATGFSIVGVGFIPISIHAPRVGSDQGDHLPVLAHCHFNPRSPCGERRQSGLVHKEWCGYFNPRSPCGERPIMWRRRRSWGVFQSTLPVWGATRFTCSSKFSILDFNPRSPCGERQNNVPSQSGTALISIHAPRVGSDSKGAQFLGVTFGEKRDF